MKKLVNFPTRSKKYSNTDEGGMTVKLVVVCGASTGAAVFDMWEEELVFDDQRPKPEDREISTFDELEAYEREREAWVGYHYPRINSYPHVDRDFVSRPYTACIVLGSTTWSGVTKAGYWGCTFDDLTDEGKALYRQMQALYPGCDLHLLTFLDT